MAGRTRTLAQLRSDVRQRADCEGDPHISDAELTRYINQSCAALHAKMVDVNELYFFQEQNLVTVAGVDQVNLSISNSFYKLLHVEVQIGSIWRTLDRWTFEKRTLYRNASSWGLSQLPISYRLSRAQNGAAVLVLAPTPDAAYPLIVASVQSFADLAADADTYDGADGWEEWVVWDSAIKCLVKSEESIVDATRERDAVWARIEPQLHTPDLEQPAVVRDTAGAIEPPLPYGWLR